MIASEIRLMILYDVQRRILGLTQDPNARNIGLEVVNDMIREERQRQDAYTGFGLDARHER